MSSVTGHPGNEQLKELTVEPIGLKPARRIVTACHYMKTWPQGATHAYGVLHNGKCKGVIVLGETETTRGKVAKYSRNMPKGKYIELQRTWISDELGHNTESYCMARVMQSLKALGVWVVLTHSGGCKDDVGFIFQASGWLYFGYERCNDFYLTNSGSYKSLIGAMRYGRVPKGVAGKGKQHVGEFLFGPGQIVHARRHWYLYPINRGVRRRLAKIALPYPKDPARFRRDQRWCTDDLEEGPRGAGVIRNVSGSIPDSSAKD